MYNKRWDAKTDRNHSSLLKLIRQIPNVSVSDLSGAGGGVPDVMLGINGRNYLIEIKPELVKGEVFASQSKLNPLQVEWHDNWLGQVNIVRTLSDVLEVIGIDSCG